MKNTTALRSNRNMGKGEQIFSLIAGSYLLYKSRLGIKSFPKAVIAAALLYRGSTAHCPAYQMLGVDTSTEPSPINVKTSLTVNKPRSEVYAFWRKLENLPRFMKHLQEVKEVDSFRSEWKAKVPAGLGTIEWVGEILSDRPGENITWRSVEGSQIDNMGSVSFEDAGKFGTQILVEISYHAPAGNIGAGIAKLFTPAFEVMIREDIKNFRRIIETGELPTIEGQPSGANN